VGDPELYAGIMSGTSLDGVDAALVEFTGEQIKLKGTHYQVYGQPVRDALLALHHPSGNELHQAHLTGNELARLYAATMATLMQTTGVTPAQIRAIGCHGQTIRHRPELGYTVQLGNAALLAELTGISVISDFRSRDIAAGGQGAPLVPVFHDKVLRHPDIHRAIVNIGGISNLTDLPPNKSTSDKSRQDSRLPMEVDAAIPAPNAGAHRVMAATTGFDCGPGNLLMDAWIARHHGKPYDENGAWAASGQVIPALLQKLLAEPFFHAVPPKSSGRDLFNLGWLEKHLQGNEAPADVQATLLALTAHAIADGIRRFCQGAEEIYLCGGGAHNSTLTTALRENLPECRIELTDKLGIPADWMEAIAFAWLARQAIHGEPASLPAVTGARHPCVLGAIYPA
jgi:anhydro-N-acetylmuramic acid kinase